MDAHFEASEKVNLPGIKKHLFVHADGVKIDPLFKKSTYFIYCIAGLNLLYRIFLNRRISFLEHCIHKEISYDETKEPVEY
jgi:hypothetical protein